MSRLFPPVARAAFLPDVENKWVYADDLRMSDLKAKTNILFLSYGEDLVQNSILQNQFVDFACGFDAKKYGLFSHSFVPISRTRLFRSRHWKEAMALVSKRMDVSYVSFGYSYLPALANWLYASWLQMLFFHNPYHYLKLYYLIKRNNINFIYCRGYHSALAANFIKTIFRIKVKIQFDPRGMFVEEGIYLGKISYMSLNLWRKCEQYIYEVSDIVTFVSDVFRDKYINKFEVKKNLVIYTHTDVNNFSAGLNVPGEKISYCFLGHIHVDGFYPIGKLLILFKELLKTQASHLYIITRSEKSGLLKEVDREGLGSYITIQAAETTAEVSKLLSQVHFGIIFYKDSVTPLEKDLASSVVTIKAGEYLASGLPIVCNKSLSAISSLVEKNKLGVTYAANKENQIAGPLKVCLSEYEATARRCREVAEKYFDRAENIKKLCAEIDR